MKRETQQGRKFSVFPGFFFIFKSIISERMKSTTDFFQLFKVASEDRSATNRK